MIAEPLHATLALWGNFCLIAGSAAAALTGLQYVVQTLTAGNSSRPVTGNDPVAVIAASGTPTVVHFSKALLLSHCSACRGQMRRGWVTPSTRLALDR